MSSWDHPLESAHAWRLTRVGRLLRRHLVSLLASWDADLTPEQYFVLLRLHDKDGRVQGELVDPDLNDRPNITRLVGALERKGLVARRRDPEDGRRQRVHLTLAGRDRIEALLPRVQAVRASLLGDLEPDDLAALERVLDHLEARLV